MNGAIGTAAVSWGPDRIDLFWVGQDGALMHRVREGDGWLEAESLGGTVVSAPAVTAWAERVLDLAAQHEH